MHSLDDFISAREHLAQVLLSTKLIYSPIFSEESGNKVFIKPENLQKTGSFKIRGAYNKILKLSPEEKKRGSSPLLQETMHKGLPMPLRSWGSKP